MTWPLPTLLVDADGEFEFNEGTLFHLDPDLGGSSKLAAYSRLTRAGFSDIDFGFSAFVQFQANGSKRIYVGLAFRGDGITRRFSYVPRLYSRDSFKEFIRSRESLENEARGKAEADIDVLIHDLRALSTSIYHAAEEAHAAANDRNFSQLHERLNTIIAAQFMLKLRTDLLDFSGNPTAEVEAERVPIYRRVDKVVRCFQLAAANHGQTISIKGNSFSFAFGPNVFEIVPYVLIDNAIKYAPANSDIVVRFTEYDQEIRFSVESLGPRIMESENQSIFTKGFRGKAVSQAIVAGSGIGLFLALNLVNKFNGTLSVDCGSVGQWFDSREYFLNRFVVALPMALL